MIVMPNPAKPTELKKHLGNPGKRPLPAGDSVVVSVPFGYAEPLREFGSAGQALWDSVFALGELWVSSRTDTNSLQMTCEQLDRREDLRRVIAESDDWHLLKQLNDLERLIASNLGQLGFTPAERARLGLAEVKAKSKLEELMAKKAARE